MAQKDTSFQKNNNKTNLNSSHFLSSIKDASKIHLIFSSFDFFTYSWTEKAFFLIRSSLATCHITPTVKNSFMFPISLLSPHFIHRTSPNYPKQLKKIKWYHSSLVKVQLTHPLIVGVISLKIFNKYH